VHRARRRFINQKPFNLRKGAIMFTGLSAFPLTPLDAGVVDQKVYVRLIQNLAEAKVDSIGALGSTGSYAYLNAMCCI
jgi:dihydrodipicolinate synthase/N-acetylneuraminate lyase